MKFIALLMALATLTTFESWVSDAQADLEGRISAIESRVSPYGM